MHFSHPVFKLATITLLSPLHMASAAPKDDNKALDPVKLPENRNCAAAPTGPVKDAHKDENKLAAGYFCAKYASTTVTSDNVDIAHTIAVDNRVLFLKAKISTGTDREDDVYDISVRNIENCKPDGGEYNLGNPVADHTCSELLHDAWKGCNNQGRGGALTAGCLVYSMTTKY